MAGFILTTAGSNLLAQALAGKTLTFTRAAVGDSTNEPTAEQILAFTTLQSEKISCPIVDIAVSGGEAKICAEVTNVDVTTAFRMTEYGVFAKIDNGNPTLYAYFYDPIGDLMPANDTGFLKDFIYELNCLVSNAANIQAVINKNQIQVSRADFEAHLSSNNPHPNWTPTVYTLPTASTTTKGGIKIGTGLSMNGETLNATATTYTLPTASTTTKGGVKIGTGLSMDGETLNADATTYTLPTAAPKVKGGVKVGESIYSGLIVDNDSLKATARYLGSSHNMEYADDGAAFYHYDTETVYIAVKVDDSPSTHRLVALLTPDSADSLLPAASTTKKGCIKLGHGLAKNGSSDSVDVALFYDEINCQNATLRAAASEPLIVKGKLNADSVQTASLTADSVAVTHYFSAASVSADLNKVTLTAQHASVNLTGASLINADRISTDNLFSDLYNCNGVSMLGGVDSAHAAICGGYWDFMGDVNLNGNSTIKAGTLTIFDSHRVSAANSKVTLSAASIDASNSKVTLSAASVNADNATVRGDNVNFNVTLTAASVRAASSNLILNNASIAADNSSLRGDNVTLNLKNVTVGSGAGSVRFNVNFVDFSNAASMRVADSIEADGARFTGTVYFNDALVLPTVSSTVNGAIWITA